jgi:acetyl-CoA carboxylase carboxyl transferase subunit beta
MLWRKLNLKTRYVLELENQRKRVEFAGFFAFIGSMGAVVGEKSQEESIILSKQNPIHHDFKIRWSRMMEAAYSLMQKTSVKLAQLAEEKIPYISLCTDPTTGGTTASYAMLGDINISEPGALIGFTGPRVVRDTTGKDLQKVSRLLNFFFSMVS